jgi:hypothetical protein
LSASDPEEEPEEGFAALPEEDPETSPLLFLTKKKPFPSKEKSRGEVVCRKEPCALKFTADWAETLFC